MLLLACSGNASRSHAHVTLQEAVLRRNAAAKGGGCRNWDGVADQTVMARLKAADSM